MDIEKKRKECEKFRNSSKFGSTTYFLLGSFQMNLNTVLTTIGLYDVSITKLEEKFKLTITENGSLRVKHQLILDIVGKIMVLIESFLILCHALSKNYDQVPELMTYYENSLLDQVLKNFKNKKYNLRKISGLADIGKLHLSNEEQKIISKEYEATCDAIREELSKWAEFYDEFRLIYGKTRHGMSYLTGVNKISDDVISSNFENSLIVAFHRKRIKSLPKNIRVIDPKNKKKNETWFEIESWLKIQSTLFNKLGVIIKNMGTIGNYIIENHLLFSDNCGEDYVPCKIEKNKISYGVFYGPKLNNNNDEKTSTKICERIGKNMNIVNRRFSYTLSLNNKEFISAMNEEIITNFWYGKNTSDLI